MSTQPEQLRGAEFSARRNQFRQLHLTGCFLLPNPWDVGSAKYLESLGFKALATTSAGAAWRNGKPDGAMQLEEVLQHLREIVSATRLPVNADFESGYAADPRGLARNVRLALDTGVAGLSIEDSTGTPERPLRTVAESVERIRAARLAIDEAETGALLVARAENYVVGRPDLADVILRLKAYAEAGADCLYAPGIRTRSEIAAVVAAVAPKPVNLMVGARTDLSVQEIEAMGVRRVSVGGALARTAWGAFMRASQMIAARGKFDAFADAVSGSEMNAAFRS
jgi:2-methylisocitrate lyase-like PEP mutase family enzyme